MKKTFFILTILSLFLAGCSLRNDSADESLNQSANNQPGSQPVSDDLTKLDSDSDGLTDEAEKQFGSDPQKSDTDGDGYSDKVEIDSGNNPLAAHEPESPKAENDITEKVEPMIDEECSLRGDKLEGCEIYTCYYTHPFTRTKMKVEVLGYVAGKCFYKEELPGGMLMECRYEPVLQKEVAQFYKDNALPQAGETVKLELETADRGSLEGKSYVGGQEASNNVLNEAISSGQCVVIAP